MKIKKPKKYPLADAFLKLLKDNIQQPTDGELYAIYYHLFSILPIEKLEVQLQSYKQLADGKDHFFKAEGKKIWYGVFHKAIRQCDFFNDTYVKTTIEIMTDLEKQELRFLMSKVRTEGYVKDGQEGQMFNDEYRRYLELHEMKRDENKEKSIGGHLDMILWHTIHLDKKNVLKKVMEVAFNPKALDLIIKP
jgi:hypothetical protein